MNQRDKTSARFHVSRSTVKRIFAHWSGKNSMPSVFQAFSEHTKNCPCLRKVLFSRSPRPIFKPLTGRTAPPRVAKESIEFQQLPENPLSLLRHPPHRSSLRGRRGTRRLSKTPEEPSGSDPMVVQGPSELQQYGKQKVFAN